MPAPKWLPAKLDVNGEWLEILGRLYKIFQVDFVGPGCYYQGSPVRWDQRKLDGQYEEGFWHLITRDDYSSGDRLFDAPRAACLPWCRPCLVNAPDRELKIWNYRESNRKLRTYIWLEDCDYVVILEGRPERQGRAYFLITAHSVDGNDTRRKLAKKHQRREP